MPTCSVIVCTRYRTAALQRCLESVKDLEHSSYEVLVVDNTDGDPEAARLASDAGARYVREQRTGLSRSRNAGALEAKGDLIAFLDDDAIAEPAWLFGHAAALEEPGIAASAGRILPISGNSGGERSLDLGDSPQLVDATTQSWFEMANFGGLGFGGNMAFRKELFDEGFRFKESLGAGATIDWGEEYYAFFTLLKQGQRVAYVPGAIVRHDSTARTLRDTRYARRASAAYLSMLFVEEPSFRRRTARYALEALRGRDQEWRRLAPAERPGRLKRLAAALAGPLLYARSRIGSGSGK